MNEIDQFTKRHRKDSKEGSLDKESDVLTTAPPLILSEELIKDLFDLVCYDDYVDDDYDDDDDDYDNYDTDY